MYNVLYLISNLTSRNHHLPREAEAQEDVTYQALAQDAGLVALDSPFAFQ